MENVTLLIADDNAAVRRVLARSLSRPERSTVEASDGQAALEAARNSRPDLIILDVRMPGLNGHEVCRALKADQSTRGIPILMLSGLSEPEEEIAGLDLGADGYVSKPFNLNELEARVGALLRGRPQRKALS